MWCIGRGLREYMADRHTCLFSTSVSFYRRWDPVERTDFLCIVLCEMDTFKMEPSRRVSVESTWSSGI